MGPPVDRCFSRRAASTVLAAGLILVPALTTATASAATGTRAHLAAAAPSAAPTNLTAPSLHSESGWFAVGGPITADPGTWDTEGLQLAYQWALDGTAVAGATTDTYTPVVADLDTSLTVTVTASAGGETGEPATSAPVKVDKGDIHYLTLPSISGDARPGSLLTLDPGTWDVATATPTLEWYAGEEVVGEGTTYRVRPADFGKDISASVMLKDPSYYWALAFTDARTVAPGTLTNRTAPRVVGTPVVGRSVHVASGSWSATEGVTLSHRWTVDGKPVAGATGTTFTVPASAAGKKVAVVETAGGRAWTSASQTSTAATARKATSTVSLKLSAPARGRITVVVTVKAAVPTSGRVVVTVAGRSRTVTLRSGKATLTVTGLRKGTTRVTARYQGSGSVAADAGTASIRVK